MARGAATARRARALPLLGPALTRSDSFLVALTTMGRACVASFLICWWLAATRHWLEAWVLTLALGVLLLLSVLASLGRAVYTVRLRLVSTRVVVGEPALGSVALSHVSGRATRATVVEMPVGEGLAVFDIPRLPAGMEHQEVFTIPTHRRGVVAVGPVRSIRGDSLGLMRRAQNWTDPLDLYIHPRTIRLDSTAVGFIRDIEGAVTQDLSSSDVAFHALRDYVPGDDRRNVHWRTTARTGRLTVRQFEETRRAHLLVVLDLDTGAWPDAEEFETAISTSASLVLAAMREHREVSLVTQSGRPLLDTASRALDTFTTLNPLPDACALGDLSRQAVQAVPQASAVVLVTGPSTPSAVIHRAHAELPLNAQSLAVRIEADGRLGSRRIGGLHVLTLPALDMLPAAMRKSVPR